LLPIVQSSLQGALLTPSAMLPGFVYAAALALIVGALPAIRALRLDVVDALAERR
jgi:ABC-type antimicrobial peptide transport system permease subunit